MLNGAMFRFPSCHNRVAPGTDLAPDEKRDTTPALLDPARRRR
jgi:hypothetical protein